MSKLTGTIAFVGGVLLIALAITGVLIKNENRLAHMPPHTEVEELVESDHGGAGEVPTWLRLTMYGTLILSGAFTIIQVSRYGMSTERSSMSTAAFIGGMALIGLGFVATLVVNESKFIEHDKLEANVASEAIKIDETHDNGEHDSGIPDVLKYLMMGTLFISGGVAVFHVSKYGLD